MNHKNLASERVRIGLSQTQLAERLGVKSYKTVSNYESGKVPVPQEVLARAADLFGCSVDYLLDRTDERLPRSVA